MPTRRTKQDNKEVPDTIDAVNDLIDAFRQETGAQELDDAYNIYGFELTNNLPLQYVLGINVIAFGRGILLVGPPQGGKSQMAYYLSSLFAMGGGLVNMFETEGKVSKEQIYGIWGDQELVRRKLSFKYCRTQQEVQTNMMKNTKKYEEVCREIGRWPPLCSIVDSLSGNTSQDHADAIEEEGSADMTVAGMHKAKSWKDWFQVYVPNHVAMLPYTMIIVNHEGTVIDMGGGGFGGPQKNTGAGGVMKDYLSTWTLSLSTSQTVIEKVGQGTDYGRHSVTTYYIKNIKNSLGIKSRKMSYEVIAYRDAENRRILKIDWDSALVDLLDDKALKLEAGSVARVIDLKGQGQKWTCPAVGIDHKDSPVSKSDMGRLLHNTPEVYRLIQRELLDISVYPTWNTQEAHEIATREINARLASRGEHTTKRSQKRKKR